MIPLPECPFRAFNTILFYFLFPDNCSLSCRAISLVPFTSCPDSNSAAFCKTAARHGHQEAHTETTLPSDPDLLFLGPVSVVSSLRLCHLGRFECPPPGVARPPPPSSLSPTTTHLSQSHDVVTSSCYPDGTRHCVTRGSFTLAEIPGEPRGVLRVSVACSRPCAAERCSVGCMHHSGFHPPPAKGRLGCPQFGAFDNKAAADICAGLCADGSFHLSELITQDAPFTFFF